MDKNKAIILIIIIGTALILATSFKDNVDSEVSEIEGDWDISDQVSFEGYEEYLIEEKDFDYSDQGIYLLAETIKKNSDSPQDAVKQTIRYVAKSIRYDAAVSVSYCYNEKASDVLESGKGDCVSMSRLVTSLLRAQGIPARTSGGCLSATKRCSPLFSVVPGLTVQSVVLREGDFKKRGFLHEWVEVWTPETDWMLIEATSGQSFDLECNTYLQYSYDSNNYNRCVINDRSFWNECGSY